MRKLTLAAAGAALSISAASSAASVEYFLKVEGVARPGASGPVYLDVDPGDLDGDGAADDAVVRLHCEGGKLRQAFFHRVKTAREAGSALATGRRSAAPGVPAGGWIAPGETLARKSFGYDLKANKTARTGAGWVPVTLSGADGLCPAATAIINTSRSNLKH